MSLLNVIKYRKKRFRQEHPDSNTFDFVLALLEGAMRIILAKVYLRKCTSVGKYVATFGKPLIRSSGTIIIGDEVRILSNVARSKLFTGKKGTLSVGRNSRLNGVHISAQLNIRIGDNVRIAPYTIILDSDFHDIKDHFSDGVAKEVIIEDNVWLATRTTILKGVTVGSGSVVATGSVVTRDVPPNCIVAGIPARVIKRIDDIPGK